MENTSSENKKITPPNDLSDPIRAAVPYALPIVLFLGLTYAESLVPGYYPVAYATKIVMVTGVLMYYSRVWRKEIRWDAQVLPLAIIVGLVTLAEWILIDKLIPYPALGSRTGFDPTTAISYPTLRWLFIGVRFFGLALIVPVMEEVFWRSFLLRFITDQEKWQGLPVGTFSMIAFIAVAVLFALAHPEWLVALICALLYAGLLYRTKSLFACIVAHAVTNFGLGIYVLTTRDWKYW
jgi:hypothetical protein